jgi:predicted acetyltransferase
MSDDPNVLDIAEFFVLRRHRRARVGRSAALALFRALPGRWIVRCAVNNKTALPFWRSVTSEASRGAVKTTERRGKTQKFHVFEFEPTPRA